MPTAKLPKTLYVRMDEDGDGGYLPIADETAMDNIDGDGPTKLGTYQLVEIHTYRKTVERVGE